MEQPVDPGFSYSITKVILLYENPTVIRDPAKIPPKLGTFCVGAFGKTG